MSSAARPAEADADRGAADEGMPPEDLESTIVVTAAQEDGTMERAVRDGVVVDQVCMQLPCSQVLRPQ